LIKRSPNSIDQSVLEEAFIGAISGGMMGSIGGWNKYSNERTQKIVDKQNRTIEKFQSTAQQMYHQMEIYQATAALSAQPDDIQRMQALKEVKTQALFTTIHDSLYFGTYDALMDSFNDLRDIDLDDFNQSFDHDFTEAERQGFVDGLVTESKQMKTNVEAVNKAFNKNPFESNVFVSRIKKSFFPADSEIEGIQTKLFNDFKQNMAYSLTRMQKVEGNLYAFDQELTKLGVNPDFLEYIQGDASIFNKKKGASNYMKWKGTFLNTLKDQQKYYDKLSTLNAPDLANSKQEKAKLDAEVQRLELYIQNINDAIQANDLAKVADLIEKEEVSSEVLMYDTFRRNIEARRVEMEAARAREEETRNPEAVAEATMAANELNQEEVEPAEVGETSILTKPPEWTDEYGGYQGDLLINGRRFKIKAIHSGQMIVAPVGGKGMAVVTKQGDVYTMEYGRAPNNVIEEVTIEKIPLEEVPQEQVEEAANSVIGLDGKIPLDKNLTIDEFRKLGLLNLSLFGQNLHNTLLRESAKRSITIRFTTDASQTMKEAAGHYDLDKNEVVVNLDDVKKGYQKILDKKGRGSDGSMVMPKGLNSFEDLLTYMITHELLHGVTLSSFKDVYDNTKNGTYKGSLDPVQVDAINSINKIYQYLKSLDQNKYFGGKEYGMTDIYELVAEMSNESFVSALQRIELPQNLRYSNKYKNAFESIIAFIRDLFTGKKVNNNAADSLFATISDIMQNEAVPTTTTTTTTTKEDIERRRQVDLKQLGKKVLYNGSNKKFVELEPDGPIQMEDIEGKDQIYLSIKQPDGSIKLGKATRGSNGLWSWSISPIGQDGLNNVELLETLFSYKIRKAKVIAERDYDAELDTLTKPSQSTVNTFTLDQIKSSTPGMIFYEESKPSVGYTMREKDGEKVLTRVTIKDNTVKEHRYHIVRTDPVGPFLQLEGINFVPLELEQKADVLEIDEAMEFLGRKGRDYKNLKMLMDNGDIDIECH